MMSKKCSEKQFFHKIKKGKTIDFEEAKLIHISSNVQINIPNHLNYNLVKEKKKEKKNHLIKLVL